jgi:PIN domain nuclease of toxin-antitoxin system
MTAYLVDTQIVLWAAGSPERLSGAVRDVLGDPTTPVHVSAVSIAEMAIKQSIGKLSLPVGPQRLCEVVGLAVMALDGTHAERVGGLPMHHRDPFDRLLIAQALCEGMTMISADRSMTLYDVPLLVNE